MFSSDVNAFIKLSQRFLKSELTTATLCTLSCSGALRRFGKKRDVLLFGRTTLPLAKMAMSDSSVGTPTRFDRSSR